MNQSTHRMRTSGRHGFTLLELILAMGLTITLLSALYAAMELHWRLSTLGQIEVERAQIARALLTRMSADIRSASFSVEDLVGSAVSDTLDGDESEDGADDDVGLDDIDTDALADLLPFAEPGLAFTGASSGVYGDSTTLVLHISRPYREKIRSDEYASPYSKSDLKSVAYIMAEGDGILSQMASIQLAPTDGPQQGVVRLDGDRFSLSASDALEDPLDSASQARLLADEVEYVTFEYHDGFEWIREWDSRAEGRMPNAIAITLEFRNPEFAEGSILARKPAESTDTFRLVVPLVAAGPFGGLSF